MESQTLNTQCKISDILHFLHIHCAAEKKKIFFIFSVLWECQQSSKFTALNSIISFSYYPKLKIHGKHFPYLIEWCKIDFPPNSNFNVTILRDCIFHVVIFQLKYFKYTKSRKLHFNKNILSPYVDNSKAWWQILNFKINFNENIQKY